MHLTDTENRNTSSIQLSREVSVIPLHAWGSRISLLSLCLIFSNFISLSSVDLSAHYSEYKYIFFTKTVKPTVWEFALLCPVDCLEWNCFSELSPCNGKITANIDQNPRCQHLPSGQTHLPLMLEEAKRHLCSTVCFISDEQLRETRISEEFN